MPTLPIEERWFEPKQVDPDGCGDPKCFDCYGTIRDPGPTELIAETLKYELEQHIVKPNDYRISLGFDSSSAQSAGWGYTYTSSFWERANPQYLSKKTNKENDMSKDAPKIEIVREIVDYPAEPGSLDVARAAAKRKPGKYGFATVDGKPAGFIESAEVEEEKVIRDNGYLLGRMEEILEKWEKELQEQADRGLNDADLAADKEGRPVLFMMYSELLYARANYNDVEMLGEAVEPEAESFPKE